MKIGIIGAENSHSLEIAKLLNIEQIFTNTKAIAVWGETKAFAEKLAKDSKIYEIVKYPQDMIGLVDGVIIAHRDAACHVQTALPFIEKGIPVFIDKPFCYSLEEGAKLIKIAKQKKIPFTSFSILTEQDSYTNELQKKIQQAGKITTIFSSGPCDINSRWGGVFFYGIHQIELILKSTGVEIDRVQMFNSNRNAGDNMAILIGRNNTPMISVSFSNNQKSSFTLCIIGSENSFYYQNKFDKNPYVNSLKKIIKMFKTKKEPYPYEDIMKSVSILSAIEKSKKTGKCVKVEKI